MRRSRTSPLALALLLSIGPAVVASTDEAPQLTLCLAVAADQSPTYPLEEVPSTNREIVVAFRLRPGEAFEKLTHVWTAVDVGDAAPPNTEIARGDLPLQGRTLGSLRFSLPQDLPVGKYRLDVSAAGKEWASIEFPVAAPKEAPPLAGPSDLLPLEPGRRWTYSWVLEAGPAIKNMTVSGADRGADGKYRATMSVAVLAKEEGGARVEMRRGDTLVSEEWWSLTDKGLAVTGVRAGGETAAHDPPLPMIALPLRSPFAWTHRPKDGSPSIEYRMWGPLPVRTPSGEVPGWIVWMKTGSDNQVSTIERHYAPGVGVVREVHVGASGPELLTRLETALLPAE